MKNKKGKMRFHGSYEEDSGKKFRREGDRESIIAEKGIGVGVDVRVKGHDRTWKVKAFTKDYFVKLEGAGRPVSPHDLEVVTK